ncbi:hypothetical protein H6F79_24175 [Trichocoleus sp. FACHB-69]|nr:hypothetical protein [Trichocoleus sp. FACHB-69]
MYGLETLKYPMERRTFRQLADADFSSRLRLLQTLTHLPLAQSINQR